MWETYDGDMKCDMQEERGREMLLQKLKRKIYSFVARKSAYLHTYYFYYV